MKFSNCTEIATNTKIQKSFMKRAKKCAESIRNIKYYMSIWYGDGFRQIISSQLC